MAVVAVSAAHDWVWDTGVSAWRPHGEGSVLGTLGPGSGQHVPTLATMGFLGGVRGQRDPGSHLWWPGSPRPGSCNPKLPGVAVRPPSARKSRPKHKPLGTWLGGPGLTTGPGAGQRSHSRLWGDGTGYPGLSWVTGQGEVWEGGGQGQGGPWQWPACPAVGETPLRRPLLLHGESLGVTMTLRAQVSPGLSLPVPTCGSQGQGLRAGLRPG